MSRVGARTSASRGIGQVRAAAAGDHGGHLAARFGRGPQRGRRTRAGPEVPDAGTGQAGCSCSHRVAAPSRPASSPMSNTFARSRSSSAVSRSNSSVPSPAVARTSATKRLRGLLPLLPLPWAKSTIPAPPPGVDEVPGQPAPTRRR